MTTRTVSGFIVVIRKASCIDYQFKQACIVDCLRWVSNSSRLRLERLTSPLNVPCIALSTICNVIGQMWLLMDMILRVIISSEKKSTRKQRSAWDELYIAVYIILCVVKAGQGIWMMRSKVIPCTRWASYFSFAFFHLVRSVYEYG